MGQRLIIEIADTHGNLLATQYMHWSAYTGCTLECARRIYEELCDRETPLSYKGETEFAVTLLRNAFPRAALTPEAASALGMVEDRDLNRNEGLIDVTEEEMANSQGWGEGTLRVVLNEDGIDGYYIDTVWKSEPEEFIEEQDATETMKVETKEDGTKELYILNDKTKEWKKVPCYTMNFDGWTTTWEDVVELEGIYDKTERMGYAYCVYPHVTSHEKEYFIMQWIG